eukprot:m.17740 g.17740  ORF g.17740 m.17740 type:complete len:808 (-) comp6096_c0_seq2:45-2468(-)
MVQVVVKFMYCFFKKCCSLTMMFLTLVLLASCSPSQTQLSNHAQPTGMLSVTEAPYNADNTGKSDTTAALRSAIKDGYSQQLPVYFPPGRYLVNDTLTVLQQPPSWEDNDDAVNIVPNRFIVNVLIGSTDKLPERPTIVLSANSPGFNDNKNPKNVIKVTNPLNENVNMNNVFRGINIEIEEGNSGAIALYFHGAQGGATQDVSIDLTKSGFAGFAGGGGAGASHLNVEVIGGMYGVYFQKSEPCPVLAGFKLVNQSVSAILWASQGTLIVVGGFLQQGEDATGALIQAPLYPVSIVDTLAYCSESNGVLVDAKTSVYLRDVFLSPICKTVMLQSSPIQTHTSLLAANTRIQDASLWTHVNEVIYGVDFMNKGSYTTSNVIYRDGNRMLNATVSNISKIPASSIPSAQDVISKHVWDETTFPTLETSTNAVLECGVKGDGVTDEYTKLQACINNNKHVFLPKGRYRISKTLVIPHGNTLLGASQTLTVIMPVHEGFESSVDHPQPVVRVEAPSTKGINSEDEPGTILAFIGIVSWWHLPVYTMEWKAVGGMWRSNYETRVCECLWLNQYHNQTTSPPCTESINITVAKTQIVDGSGRFYNFVNDEDILFTDHTHYRHLLVANKSADSPRLVFYTLNLEHAQSEANMQIDHSTGVDIFGLKIEGSLPIIWISDSEDVTLFGLGGGADAFPSTSYYPSDFTPYLPSIFRVERSTRYKLLNLCDTGRGRKGSPIEPIPQNAFPLTPKLLSAYDWYAPDIPHIIHSMWSPWPGYSVPPTQWSLVFEANASSPTSGLLTTPNDLPVAFMRGF